MFIQMPEYVYTDARIPEYRNPEYRNPEGILGESRVLGCVDLDENLMNDDVMEDDLWNLESGIWLAGIWNPEERNLESGRTVIQI